MDERILRKLQLEELDLLNELDRVCKKNNIEYFLSYGTLLGAIRHKGFIPWDDDIDVSMTMDNYNKFAEIAQKELKEWVFFQSLDTDKHIHLFWNKIRKKNTYSNVKGQNKLKVNLGICIDIFPMCKYPKDKKLQDKLLKKIKYGVIILETELYKAGLKSTGKKGKILYSVLSLIPLSIRKRIAKKMINKVLNYNGEYDYYVDYQEFFNQLVIVPKKIIEEKLTKTDFEGKKYSVLKDYDSFLKIVYGDYMKLPPKSQRVAHGNLTIKFSDGEEYNNE